MKLKLSGLVGTLMLGLFAAICPAQDFSADVMYFTPGKAGAASGSAVASSHEPSKLYVSKDKMRLETRGITGTVLLVDGAEHTAFMLNPGRKEYQRVAGGLSEYFRVDDVENACPAWQKSAAQKIDCEKVGHEVVGGRETVKYRNKSAPEDAASAVWIDSTLKFVVKWEGGDTGAELGNIKEGQQAADLFVVPSGYEIPKPRKGQKKGFSQRSP